MSGAARAGRRGAGIVQARAGPGHRTRGAGAAGASPPRGVARHPRRTPAFGRACDAVQQTALRLPGSRSTASMPACAMASTSSRVRTGRRSIVARMPRTPWHSGRVTPGEGGRPCSGDRMRVRVFGRARSAGADHEALGRPGARRPLRAWRAARARRDVEGAAAGSGAQVRQQASAQRADRGAGALAGRPPAPRSTRYRARLTCAGCVVRPFDRVEAARYAVDSVAHPQAHRSVGGHASPGPPRPGRR